MIIENKTYKNEKWREDNFVKTEFIDCEFNNTSLYDCDFGESQFTGCTFEDVTFKRCNFTIAKFTNCRFIDCVIADSQLLFAKILDTDFRTSRMWDTTVRGTEIISITVGTTTAYLHSSPLYDDCYHNTLLMIGCKTGDYRYFEEYLKELSPNHRAAFGRLERAVRFCFIQEKEGSICLEVFQASCARYLFFSRASREVMYS